MLIHPEGGWTQRALGCALEAVLRGEGRYEDAPTPPGGALLVLQAARLRRCCCWEGGMPIGSAAPLPVQMYRQFPCLRAVGSAGVVFGSWAGVTCLARRA